MVIRNYLRCAVCGTVTVVRTQLGWLKQHPVRVHCGKCGILLLGTVYLDQDRGTARHEFENASIIDEASPEFYMEASGELLTEKIQPVQGSLPTDFSPFLKAIQAMGEGNLLKFKSRTLEFLGFMEGQWPVLRRINELWIEQKHDYVVAEIRQHLPEKQFPMNNPLEIHRAVHTLNLLFLHPLLDVSRFEAATKLIFDGIDDLSSTKTAELIELVRHFGERALFGLYEAKLLRQFGQFMERFNFLIPVFSLSFYPNVTTGLLTQKAVSTASFEDLKQLYLDSFEIAVDASTLVAAFDNLNHRSHFTRMKPIRRDVATLEQYESKAKGIRITYFDGSETFDHLLSDLDNGLRNAIGHGSYDYDGRTQKITYYPSGDRTGEPGAMYLLEFGRRCWGIFMCLVDLEELVYQGAKMHRLTAGDKPIDPRVLEQRD